jgi:hypothetical protein
MIWTFVHCGVYGKPEGFYDERYTKALEGRMADFGHTVEFVGDKDMPEPLRYRGAWGMLSLYNPDLRAGNANGCVYAMGLDTVILQDPQRIADALDDVGTDIVGCVCPSDGQFNTMVLRIRRGSPGAREVWDAATKRGFFPKAKKPFVEHKAVRRFAGNNVGCMRTGIVQSYKSHIGTFPRNHTREHKLEDLAALVFHGEPNPHDVCEDKTAPLHDVVMQNWGRYAGY